MNDVPAQNQKLQADSIEAVEKALPGKKSKLKLLILLGLFGLIFIALVSIFFFIKSAKNTGQSGGPVELVYWTAWEDPQVLEPLFKEFEKSHPNVTVKLEVQNVDSLGKYIERIAAHGQNNKGPDIFRFHNSWIPEIKQYLSPVPSDVLQSLTFEENYYTGVQKALAYKGGTWGLPLGIDTLALFVNKQIFSDAGYSSYPTTWDELKNVSREITVKDENGKILTAGVAMGTFDNIEHASDIVSAMFIQNGVDMRDLANADRRKRAETVLRVYSQYQSGKNSVWDQTQENSKLAFAKGKLAMYFGYSWDIIGLQAVNPLLEYEIIPIPHVARTNQTVMSFWSEGVSSFSPHPKEAFELLTFLSQKESLEKLFANQIKVRNYATVYPRKDMLDLLSDNPRLIAFAQQAEDGEPTLFSSDTHDDGMVDGLIEHLADAIRSLESNTSPQTAVDQLALGVQEVLSRYETPIVQQ